MEWYRAGLDEGVFGSEVLLIVCVSLWGSSGGIEPCVAMELLFSFSWDGNISP